MPYGDETDGFLAWQRMKGIGEERAPDVHPASGPSLARKAANFGKALVTHLKAGLPEADRSTVEHRLATCHSCELYDGKNGTCLHQGCGCVVEIKVTWDDQRCPIGKW